MVDENYIYSIRNYDYIHLCLIRLTCLQIIDEGGPGTIVFPLVAETRTRLALVNAEIARRVYNG